MKSTGLVNKLRRDRIIKFVRAVPVAVLLTIALIAAYAAVIGVLELFGVAVQQFVQFVKPYSIVVVIAAGLFVQICTLIKFRFWIWKQRILYVGLTSPVCLG